MDFVLMDIKNFLKKLENGQLEIEAGQWELHKDISNMKKAVEELKNLKEDVEEMRISSVQQVGLIKGLQAKIDRFKQNVDDEPVTISDSSIECEKVYRRPPNEQLAPKGYKKRKCHLIRSEEIVEITSQDSNAKSESEGEESVSNAEECTPRKKEANQNDRRSECGSSRLLYRKHSEIISPQASPDSRYSHSINNDILHRYLKDSAKYLDRKLSNSTEVIYQISDPSTCENLPSETDCAPFWKEHCPRGRSKSDYDRRNHPSTENLMASVKSMESVIPKRLACPRYPRKFALKDFLKHEKKHRGAKSVLRCKICGKGFCSKERVKEHEAIHKAMSKSLKGFRCSYCDKICSSPEKLTAHLRECRIIIRSRLKKNNLEDN